MTALSDEEVRFLLDAMDLARAGDTVRLAALIDAGLPVNLTSSSGDTLLILAAYHDHAGTVGMLLAHGADHSRVNDRGQTALGASTFRQSEPGVRLLLEAGADPAAGGQSALEIATFFGLGEMARLLAGPATGPSGGDN